MLATQSAIHSMYTCLLRATEILRTNKNCKKLIADGGAIVTDIMSFLQPAPSL
jgi:hypothetical protein